MGGGRVGFGVVVFWRKRIGANFGSYDGKF